MPRFRIPSASFLPQIAHPLSVRRVASGLIAWIAFTAAVLPGYSEAHSGSRTAPITPILECVTAVAGGSYTALFGYKNENKSSITIPVGSNNKFYPSPINRGQTTVFKPGRIVGAFRVTLPSCAFEEFLV